MGRSARAAGKNSDTLCFYFSVATIHVHISMYTYIQGLNVYWYMDIWYIICFQHMYLEPDKHWVFDPWSCLPSKATDIRVACKCTYVPCINEHIKYIYIYVYTYSLYIYKMYIYLIYMIIYIWVKMETVQFEETAVNTGFQTSKWIVGTFAYRKSKKLF